MNYKDDLDDENSFEKSKEPIYEGIPHPVIEDMKHEKVTVTFKKKNFKVIRNGECYLRGSIEDYGGAFNIRWSSKYGLPKFYGVLIANVYRIHKKAMGEI